MDLTKNNFALAVFRIGISAMFLTHGIPKAQLLFGGREIQFPDPLHVGMTASLVLAVIGEVLCPVIIILGYKVRWVAIPAFLTMLVAVFLVHGSDPFAKKEFALLYLFSFLLMMFIGGGKIGLDGLMGKKD